MRRAIRADYEQVYLLPPSLEDWIGPEHPARFVREFVDSLDMRALGFAGHESPEGGEYFASELLLKVWLYGYFRKLRSTRILERGCREEIGLIWLCGRRAPDHNTLWRFFTGHKKALRGLFAQSVRVALRLDLVGLALQAIDGTKVQALCSGRQVYDEKFNRRLLAALDEAIAEQEQELEAAETEAALPAAELPAPLRGAQALREQVAAALGEMERCALKHCHPQELEARRMGCDGRNRFGYNAQAVVDAKAQVIVAAEVCGQENDQGLLAPMADAARENTGVAVPSVADGGYASSEQFAAAQERGHEVLTPLPASSARRQEGPFHASRFVHDPARDVVCCPQGRELPFTRVRYRNGVPWRVYRSASVCAGCPVRAQCTGDRHGRTIDIGPHHQALVRHRQKLLCESAQAQLRQRGRIVEPVFAQIKHNGGFRRWTMRGLESVRAQWALLCTTWNLQVIYRQWALAR
jgi:transposase